MNPTPSNLPTPLRLSALVIGVLAVAAAMLPLLQAAGAIIA